MVVRQGEVGRALRFPRPAKQGEGGEQPSGRLRPSSTGYGCETGEGPMNADGSPSPASRTSSAQHPLPALRGEGKEVRGSRAASFRFNCQTAAQYRPLVVARGM